MSRSLSIRPMPLALFAGALFFASCDQNEQRVEGTEPGDCADAADNDDDGLFDCDDPGCAGSSECDGPENTPPTAPGVGITPVDPTTDSILNCIITAESTDAEGDTVTYRYAWTKDGFDAGVTGATVASEYTSGEEIWMCTVTPNDGEVDGAAGSASVTITGKTDNGNDDNDGDGFTVNNGDCNDNDKSIYPMAGDSYGDGVDSDCDGADCEAGSDGSTYFALCEGQYSWEDSLQNCLDSGYASLATITSPSDQNYIVDLFETAISNKLDVGNTPAGYTRGPWIGYRNDGGWTWSSGFSSSYTYWTPGEPNGADTNYCAHLYNQNSNYEWNDTICGEKLAYVCEKREEDKDGDGFSVREGDCDDSDKSIYPMAGDTFGDGIDSDCDGSDCEAGSDGGTYFALCEGDASWNDSLRSCLDLGYTSLATVTSRSEQDFVADLLKAAIANKFDIGKTPAGYSRGPWIGYKNERGWMWSSGLSSSYTYWTPGEPNGADTNHCAHLYNQNSNYEWNDTTCSESLPRICEKR